MDCSKNCFFLDDQKITYNGLMITETHQTTNLNAIGLGSCELVVVAVGGGGAGSESSYGGGGGSGSIEWKKENLTSVIDLQVLVGREGLHSRVSSNGTTILSADAGRSSSSTSGGSGYSGGGGGGNTNAGSGGSGGQDGEYGSGQSSSYFGSGGSGSDLDLSTISMAWFSLAPGNGGSSSSYNGGGGGGLMVDGHGAPGGDSHDGEGYGGGGCKRSYGRPGIVLASFNSL
jgi:hypothetical protein